MNVKEGKDLFMVIVKGSVVELRLLVCKLEDLVLVLVIVLGFSVYIYE